VSQSRRIDWPVVEKLGGFAVATGAACLVAALALLVLIGPSSGAVAVAAALTTSSTPASTATTTAASNQAAPTSSCFPLTESSGTCYNAGEFCPNADLNTSGVAANGTRIACEADGGQQPHWKACTPVTFSTTPASTPGTTPICPVALAGGATPTGGATTASTPNGAATSATPGATTSAPAGAPATGGGTGPGTSGKLAVAGGAVMVAGGGLVFLSRRRSRRRPV
jgi:LPXTG-motif cell wall-anchored protein